MLDVHPPHQAAHTWKDFFIHIATIVIGLIIAVGLEQTVEWLHRKHELRETQLALEHESSNNRVILERDVRTFWRYDAMLARDMQSLLYLKEHPQATRDDLPDALIYDAGWEFFTVANDKVAHETGTLALMKHDERARWDDLYRELEEANRDAIELAEAVDEANRINFALGASRTMGEAQIDQAIDRTAAAITKLVSLGHDLPGMVEDHADIFSGVRTPTYEQLRALTQNENHASDPRYTLLIEKTEASIHDAANAPHETRP
jgi:hypothetical protein